MQFVIIAKDGTDEDALERRMKVREQHIAVADEMVANGSGLIGGAILDDDGKMVGSVKVVNFPSREALDDYLETEPYVTGDVWQSVEVLPFRVGPSYRT